MKQASGYWRVSLAGQKYVLEGHWAKIAEENKYLRVILLEDGETVHNAFFDRSFREEEA